MITAQKQFIKPRRVRLEASTACQLRCPSCPTAAGIVPKALGTGFLKYSDFKKLIDDNPWVSNIELSNWGEIFLNPQLPAMMRYAYKRNVALHASNGANFNNVSDEALEALAKYKFQNITVSLDGASQETYCQYRVRGDFNRVIANIRKVNAFKKKYRSRYPLLKWQFTAFGHNEHEITAARAMAGEMGMSFKVKLNWDDLYDRPFSRIKDPELIKRETGLEASNRVEYIEKYGEDYCLQNACIELWINPQVNYDGRLLGCPINYWGDYGNVYEEGLLGAINNDKMNTARAMLLGKREAREDIPCTQCKFYKTLLKTKGWLTQDRVKEHFWKSRLFIMLENKVLGTTLTSSLARFSSALKSALKK